MFFFFHPHPSSYSRHKVTVIRKPKAVTKTNRFKKRASHPSGHRHTDTFMEVLQPRAGEHETSLCKCVCRVRANEIYQSRCCNRGRQGFSRLVRNQNMCQEKHFSQQMIYTCLSKEKNTISANIKLP